MSLVRYFHPETPLDFQIGVWIGWRYYPLSGFWFPIWMKKWYAVAMLPFIYSIFVVIFLLGWFLGDFIIGLWFRS